MFGTGRARHRGHGSGALQAIAPYQQGIKRTRDLTVTATTKYREMCQLTLLHNSVINITAAPEQPKRHLDEESLCCSVSTAAHKPEGSASSRRPNRAETKKQTNKTRANQPTNEQANKQTNQPINKQANKQTK